MECFTIAHCLYTAAVYTTAVFKGGLVGAGPNLVHYVLESNLDLSTFINADVVVQLRDQEEG
jgi:hypothetical protein